MEKLKSFFAYGLVLFALSVVVAPAWPTTTVYAIRDILADSIQMTVNGSISCQEGLIKWNSDDKTIDVCTEDSEVILQVGQEMHVRGTNKTGSTLTNGQVVFIDGAQGNRPTFALANATSEGDSSKTIGIVTADIENNATGYVTTTGLVRDINTNHMVVGNTVWLSTTPGEYTDIFPPTPDHAVKIGVNVVKSTNEGVIYVNPENGFEIYELHDVDNNVENAIANDIIIYNGIAFTNSPDIVIKTIQYSNTYWDDMRVDLGRVRLGVSAPTWTPYKGSEVLAFTGGPADANKITFGVQTPHRYKEGTDLDLHAHWVLEDNTECNVVWDLTYSWANIGAAFPTETSTGGTVASSGVTDQHTLTDIVTMNGTGKTLSSIILFSVTRDATDAADTCDNKDAYLLSLDLHYQVDTPGSRTEYAK